jgi:hypothetical protein
VKYVDDLLMIIPKEEVENTLTIFNGYNKNLKFTMELEDDGRLPYLDVELIRQEDGRILTKWFSKPMASNRLLNFKSNHTLKQKLNTALNLMRRVCHLTTINTARENLPLIRSILEKNNYPVCLIHKLFNEFITKKSENEKTEKRLEIKYRTFPNVASLTDKLIKCVREFDSNIKICPKNFKTVKNLHSRVKDDIETLMQTMLVYGISCLDCLEIYLGMTYQQRLLKRGEQHFGDIEAVHRLREELKIDKMWDFGDEILKLKQIELEKDGSSHQKLNKEPGKRRKKGDITKLEKLDKLEKLCEKSGLVSHHVKYGHRLDFKNIKIVDRERNRKKLEIIETLHIKTTSNNMNKKEDLNKIKNCYDGVLTKIRKKNDQRLLRNENTTSTNPVTETPS